MKTSLSLAFFAVLFVVGFCDDTSTTLPVTTEVTQTTTEASSTTLPTKSTEPPTTTTVSTTSTTEPPATTSTTEPPTTTSSTATPLTSTTTPVPSTTVVPPTSTKAPEPPVPDVGSWNVTEGDLTCIRADLRIRFRIEVQGRTDYIVLSPNATSTGNCNATNDTQELKLTDSEYTLLMVFGKDSTNAFCKNITFSYTLPESSGMEYNDTHLYPVKLGNSYMCSSTESVSLKNVTMEVFHIRIQAFGTPGNKGFGTAEDCEADNKVNDIVPIAVGIALLVLVIIVLVAYFIGRRRSRQKGYQSV
ncbi:lysosome-associated membrane glycoprotein 1 [Trichonephila clavata]|uniref:Lysosome-associated membrane glycoprotein 5 n=1 Tax=Trichonephila clavata TaxID=2740835 RepID=A0A8X6HI93_TRICU|nr:lysosome-associated membrane glycoprotein 1 [Trichonephila clavata]